jgi:transposase
MLRHGTHQGTGVEHVVVQTRIVARNEIFAVHKGHTYLTTVLDLETGRIVWVGKGRSEATLASFFAELTPEQRKSIEAVASDMAAGFRNAVEKACPHAAQVYDLFHVVAKYGREVVDVVRLEEAIETKQGPRGCRDPSKRYRKTTSTDRKRAGKELKKREAHRTPPALFDLRYHESVQIIKATHPQDTD